MSLLQSIVLGIVQGLTEFLPISSSAHLRIIPAFFGWSDPGAEFTAIIQLGTMAAVVIYFRRDLWNVATTWFRSLTRPRLRSDLNARMGWYLIIGTIPIGIIGFLFRHQIETGARSLYLMGITLIVLGLLLGAADALGSKKRPVESVTRKDAIVVGLAQALALDMRRWWKAGAASYFNHVSKATTLAAVSVAAVETALVAAVQQPPGWAELVVEEMEEVVAVAVVQLTVPQ